MSSILAVFVFFATLIGNVLSFSHRFLGALLSAILFAAAFVFWTYYPHHLPLPTTLDARRRPRGRRAAGSGRARRPGHGRATRSPTSRRRHRPGCAAAPATPPVAPPAR